MPKTPVQARPKAAAIGRRTRLAGVIARTPSRRSQGGVGCGSRRQQGSEKWFAQNVVPLLANLSIAKIIRVTGFSPRYASLVRKGEYMPHPVLFTVLSELVGIREEDRAPNP